MGRDHGSEARPTAAGEVTGENLTASGTAETEPEAASYLVIRSREAPPRPKPAPPAVSSTTRTLWRSRRLQALVVLGAVAALVFGVYSMGKPAVPALSRATDQASAQPSAAPIDQAKIAELMKQISANPRDTVALQALGDLYFQGGDYRTASVWEQKILAIDPKNVTALLAFGAAQFNLGNGTDAETSWLKVTEIDPRKAEAHYDLGFLYLSQNPPDMAKVRKEWGIVVAIDPNSSIAKTVSAHLTRLDNPSPSASAASPGK